MRVAGLPLLAVVSAMALPWACDDTPSELDPSGTGTSTGPGGPGGGGPGGSGAECGADCTVHCEAPPTEGNGDCIDVSGPFACNPVTNEPCSGGRVCDFGPGGFACYAGGDSRGLCESCGPTSHCAAGLTCSPFSVCTKFCCTDADCGSAGMCELLPPLPIGTCVKGAGGPGPASSSASSGPASSSSSSGAGGDGGGGASSSSSSSSASAGGAGGAGGA